MATTVALFWKYLEREDCIAEVRVWLLNSAFKYTNCTERGSCACEGKREASDMQVLWNTCGWNICCFQLHKQKGKSRQQKYLYCHSNCGFLKTPTLSLGAWGGWLSVCNQVLSNIKYSWRQNQEQSWINRPSGKLSSGIPTEQRCVSIIPAGIQCWYSYPDIHIGAYLWVNGW